MQNNTEENKKTYCGHIAIIGRPNVGKSTLLNAILGKKISITSRKPQTTRQQILGIKTVANSQLIFTDTPGLFCTKTGSEKKALNRRMLKNALNAIHDVDLIIFVCDGLNWNDDDEWILDKVKKETCPVILVVNKVDQIKNKGEILPHLEKLKEKANFSNLVPISAKNSTNVLELEKIISRLLPENPFLFAKDQITDRGDKFLASEIIREKLMRFLGEELPYAVLVHLEKFEQTPKLVTIHALILVEKDSQKAIVIGKNGLKLKEIGTNARLDMEKLFDNKVFLKLWVKVKNNWRNNEKLLEELEHETY